MVESIKFMHDIRTWKVHIFHEVHIFFLLAHFIPYFISYVRIELKVFLSEILQIY